MEPDRDSIEDQLSKTATEGEVVDQPTKPRDDLVELIGHDLVKQVEQHFDKARFGENLQDAHNLISDSLKGVQGPEDDALDTPK